MLFALVQERSPVLMRRILRAGADELLFLPLDIGDATRALLKISETRRKAERQTGGVVVSLVSTVGGVGVTSLAANLGLALRYALNKRVAVVDLDLQTGGLAVFLNLEPERTIMQLCEGDESWIRSARIRANQASVGHVPVGGSQADRRQRISGRQDHRRGARADAPTVRLRAGRLRRLYR